MSLVRNMMHMNAYYSYRKIYTPMLMINVFLKLIKLNLHFDMIVVTLQIIHLCIDWSLHIDNSSNVQTIRGMLHQVMEPRVKLLKNYSCLDGCQKINTSTKVVYVIKLSNALIIQLNIFKYIHGISKKVIPNLSIDEGISISGNTI